jgi:sarcosine oxidase
MMIDHVRRIFPAIDPTIVRDRVCYYTTTDDESFLIGMSSADPRLVYASACSGHGFKFARLSGSPLHFSHWALSRWSISPRARQRALQRHRGSHRNT